MAAKADAANSVTPAVDDSVSGNAKPSRPDWAPEKFWNAETGEVNAEGLAKSYAELESKLGGDTAGDADSGDAAADADTAKAVGVSEKEFNGWVEAYQKDGKVGEETYARLEKLGFGKEVVDAYIEGQQARSSLAETQLLEPVGGRAAFDKMTAWAADNWGEDNLKAYNDAVDSPDSGKVTEALSSLKKAYIDANGSEPTLAGGESAAEGAGGYSSKAQMQKDMGNPDYARDPAFRQKVMERIKRTPDSILL